MSILEDRDTDEEREYRPGARVLREGAVVPVALLSLVEVVNGERLLTRKASDTVEVANLNDLRPESVIVSGLRETPNAEVVEVFKVVVQARVLVLIVDSGR